MIDHSPTKYGKNNSCLDRPLCIIVLKILMKLKVKYGTNNSDLDKPVFIFAHEGSNDIKSSCPVKCTGVNLPRSKSLRLLRSRSCSCCLFLPFHLLKIRTVSDSDPFLKSRPSSLPRSTSPPAFRPRGRSRLRPPEKGLTADPTLSSL